MIIENITNDPTDAAVLSAVPCFPVPPSGVSPAIAALRQARDGHGILVGHDGLMLVLRRAWLALDQHISPPIPIHLPYGSIGANRCALRCGLIPAWIFAAIDEHFAKAAPNEAAAFVTWQETTGTFDVVIPDIVEATPSRLVYRPPVLRPGEHLVADLHSHGAGKAFFSTTDDADDAHSTKIAIVLGGYGSGERSIAMRLCAHGAYIAMPVPPFEKPAHVR